MRNRRNRKLHRRIERRRGEGDQEKEGRRTSTRRVQKKKVAEKNENESERNVTSSEIGMWEKKVKKSR
jgi:hypothetical protein